MPQKELELEHLGGNVLLGAKTTSGGNKVYRFYAQMRDNRIILLCEWDNLEFFEMIMNQFEESDNIARFIIGYDKYVVDDKVLKPRKKEVKCLKKQMTKDH